MSRWTANYQSQQALTRMQNIVCILQKVAVASVPPPEKEEFARALKVGKLLEVRFATLDPELFNQHTWGNFGSWLVNAESYANNVLQNPASGYVQHVNNMFDEMLNVLRPLDVQFNQKEVKALADASAAFQQKIVEELERVKKRAAEIKSEFTKLENAITTNETRINETNKVIEQQKNRLDQSIAEFQKQFLANESARAGEFTKTNQKGSDDFKHTGEIWKQKFDAQQKAVTAEFSGLFESNKQSASNHLKWMEQKEQEIRRIFNVIGNVAVSGDFKNTAERERSSANWLRGIAIVLMMLMGTGAVIAFVQSFNHPDIDWKIFAFRLSTTLILGVPAFYAAQESAKHREREKLARKLHLELSSIDAYLELLPPDQRQQIKGRLTDRFFGQPELKEKDETVTKHDLFDLMSKILQNVTKPK